MTNSILNIFFDEASRKQLTNNGQKVLIIRNYSTQTQQSVVYAVCDPCFAKTTMEFTNKYSLYVSNKSIYNPGDQIIISQYKQAQFGNIYTFTNGTFTVKTQGLSNTEIGLQNDQKTSTNYFFAGIAQKSPTNLNDNIWYPQNIFKIPFNETSYIKIDNKALVLVASNIMVSELVSSIKLRPINIMARSQTAASTFSQAIEVDLSINKQDIHWDTTINQFVKGQGSSS